MYENMLQNAPNCTIQKKFMPPNPPSNRLATPRFAACHSPSPPKSWPTLANPAYVHGLLLRNLFEEMRS